MMGYGSDLGRRSGQDFAVEKRQVAAKFALSKRLPRILPPTKLYWDRDWKGCCG